MIESFVSTGMKMLEDEKDEKKLHKVEEESQ